MNKLVLKLAIAFVLLMFGSKTNANSLDSLSINNTSIIDSNIVVSDSILHQVASATNDTITQTSKDTKKELRKRKAVDILFSFPFPFGFMGAHRVMLGTKPWVPVVYMVTLGGCLGVLPTIDFFVLLLSKNVDQYENNPNIFMWLK